MHYLHIGGIYVLKPIRYFHPHTENFPLQVTYWSYSRAGSKNRTFYCTSLIITYMYEGCMQTRIRDKDYLLEKGDFRIVLPGDIITTHFPADSRIFSLWVRPQLLELPESHLIRQKIIAPIFSGELDCPRQIRPGTALHDLLYREFSRLDPEREGEEAYDLELFAMAVNLLAGLRPYCQRTVLTATPGENTVQSVLGYLREHYREKVSLEQLSEFTHLNGNYLCSVFKKHVGVSIFTYLNNHRLQKAETLLKTTTLPVGQIAEQCGFPSVGLFFRKFKERQKVTPAEYRKKYYGKQTEHDYLL